MTDTEARSALNTDPVSYRCGWCGQRMHRESSGYFWTCRTFGHPSSHDQRRKGLRAAWNALLGSLLTRSEVSA